MAGLSKIREAIAKLQTAGTHPSEVVLSVETWDALVSDDAGEEERAADGSFLIEGVRVTRIRGAKGVTVMYDGGLVRVDV